MVQLWYPVDDPAGTLIRVHPIPYLHHRKLEQTDIDDVASHIVNLNPVTNIKWAA